VSVEGNPYYSRASELACGDIQDNVHSYHRRGAVVGLFKAKELSVVVPTHNEAENLAELMKRVADSLKDINYEVVFVDDASPDGTADVADRIGKSYGNVRVLRRSGKMGLASAVLDGMKLAEADVIAVMDADLQHPPELLPRMYEKLRDGHSLVVASRYVEGGGVEGWGLRRRLLSKGATMLGHLLLPKTRKIRDPMSGYFMLNKEVLEGARLTPTGFKILLEILAKGKYASSSEVPYTFKTRRRGESKLGWKETYDYLKHLYRVLIDTKEHLRFGKFCIVGLTGVAVGQLSLWLLTDMVGLYYLVSKIFSTEIAILNNFAWNDIWTFRDKTSGSPLRSLPKRLLNFNVARIAGIALGLIVLATSTELFGIHYLVSNFFAIAIETILNFFVSIHWVWI